MSGRRRRARCSLLCKLRARGGPVRPASRVDLLLLPKATLNVTNTAAVSVATGLVNDYQVLNYLATTGLVNETTGYWASVP